MLKALSRRDLLKTTIPFTAVSYARIPGANDRIGVALAGCGNRGNYLMSLFQKSGNVSIAAVCDVFGEKAEKSALDAAGAAQYSDHRKLLEQKDVDAVIVATPDHWHAQIAIDAMNAGKDVYVEKPLMFRHEEGPAIITAAEAGRRICQVGLQQRSGDLFLKAKTEFFDSGRLGRVSMVRTVWHYGPPFDLGDPNEAKPASLDWNRFLGQVPWREWNPHQYHHYRLYLDFGCSCLTDLFTHWIDVVHMLMGRDRPKSVTAVGGIFVAQDDRTAPDTANVVAEYDGFTVTFESASLPGMPLEHVEFLGTEGCLRMTRLGYRFTPKEQGAKPVVFEERDTLVEAHIENFLSCCRSRKQPNCDARQGALAAEVCLRARESYIRHMRRSSVELT